MPATEKTWYNQSLLHTIFAASSLLLLASTFLLFKSDHDRPWKEYQRQFMSMEQKLAAMQQLEFETAAFQQQHDGLVANHRWVRADVPPEDTISRFIEAFDVRQREASDAAKPPEANTEALEQLLADLVEQSGAAGKQREALDAMLLAEAPSEEIKQAENEVTAAVDAAIEARESLLDALRDIIQDAVYAEERLLTLKKNASAEFDAANANLGLGVRDGKSAEEMQALQEEVGNRKNVVEAATKEYQDAVTYRESLDKIVQEITAEEGAATKALGDLEAERNRLIETFNQNRSTYFSGQFPFLGKKWTEFWFLDGFGPTLSIDNLWTAGLTQNNNFLDVLRYDRCTTCHQGIDKTFGSAVQPAYPEESTLRLLLMTPSTRPERTIDEEEKEISLSLFDVYGLQLAEEGLIHADDVTVAYVVPLELAARAAVLDTTHPSGQASPGLQLADVIVAINGNEISSADEVRRMLVDTVRWGEPITLTLRRGIPQPFATHPKLDLYMGSVSPHPIERFGCTICHEGQGSATDFRWASHSPNSIEEGKEWASEHDWFDNPHWIYPMYPDRFIESTCLKCHHQVEELRPSEQFDEPPAPTLVKGYDLIRTYGCYGCHEIGGFNGDERIGPDMRVEPNYFASALQLQIDPDFDNLPADLQASIEQLAQHPERDDLRAEVYDALERDSESEEPVLSSESHSLAQSLKDMDHPGTLRKTGPSLRYVGSKLDEAFLLDWVQQPRHFRPDTRMPQFFGLWDHLEGEGLEAAREYEPIEIRGIVRFLLDRSQPFDTISPEVIADDASTDDQIAQGRVLFETQGCLACHQHDDFPLAQSTFAPNLSRIADKLSTNDAPDGKAWLYTWLRRPNQYHARTRMPNLFLGPKTTTDDEGNEITTDTASDIATYLLSRETDWQPRDSGEINSEALHSLVLELLEGTYFKTQAERYLEEGIPASERENITGAEIELVLEPGTEFLSEDQMLLYVGRKAITKYGCAACHDIPGFEGAQPIGTSLAEWGRKNTSQIAFEHILEYLEGHGHGSAHSHADENGTEQGNGHHGTDGEDDRYHGLVAPDLPEYYLGQLEAGHREGFLYEKLLAPRSFDYHAVENKGYNERLRMPQFPFTHEEREAVATFVLGLVSDPPADQFVYHPDARDEAMIAGRQVIETFNCAGCHQFDLDRWDISFPPGTFAGQEPAETFDFLYAQFSPEEIADSLIVDDHGLHHAQISGQLRISDRGVPLIEALDPVDDEYYPLDEFDEVPSPDNFRYAVELWDPVVLEGHTYDMKSSLPQIPASMIDRHHAAWGGAFPQLMIKRIIRLEGLDKGAEAWGWLPPPLVGEGMKVQSAWLHDFLLDPYPIRPATRLRMPQFNMSPDQATAIVNYFAARDDANYPYEGIPQRDLNQLERRELAYQQILQEQGLEGTRYDDAMQIIVDYASGCAKCHHVADFVPEGGALGSAPDLASVHQRLRSDYLRRWIAKPDFSLPYTPMPPIIPFSHDLETDGFYRTLTDGSKVRVYHGHSEEQLDAVVDLLMNFDRYNQSRSLVTPLVEEARALAAPPEEEGASP